MFDDKRRKVVIEECVGSAWICMRNPIFPNRIASGEGEKVFRKREIFKLEPSVIRAKGNGLLTEKTQVRKLEFRTICLPQGREVGREDDFRAYK